MMHSPRRAPTSGVISSSPRGLTGDAGCGSIGPIGLTCRPRHAAFQESPPDAALRLPDIRSNSSRTDAMLISADAKLMQVERDHLGRDDHMFMYSHYKVAHHRKSSATSDKSPRSTPSSTRRPPNISTTTKSHHQQQFPRRPKVSCEKLAALMSTKDTLDAVTRGSRRRPPASTTHHIGATTTSCSNTEANTTNVLENDFKVTLSSFYASADRSGNSEDYTGAAPCGGLGDAHSGGRGFDEVPYELHGLVKSMPTQRAYDAYTQSSCIVSLLWEQFDAKLLALPHSSLSGAASSSSRPLIAAQVPAARAPLQAPSTLGITNPSNKYDTNHTAKPVDLTSGRDGLGEADTDGPSSFSLMEEDEDGILSTQKAAVTMTTADMPVFNQSVAKASSFPNEGVAEEDLVDWLVLESVLEKAGVVENYTFSEVAYDGINNDGDSSSPTVDGNMGGQMKTFHYEGPPVRGVLASKRIQVLQRLWCSTRDSALVGI